MDDSEPNAAMEEPGSPDISSLQSALGERHLRYDAIFGAMAEGFVLCEVERDEEGRLVDYTIVEANPALLRMVGPTVKVVGAKLSDGPGGSADWLAFCDRVLQTGEPAGFEYHDPNQDRWYEIRVSRVTPSLMAQLFFDITDRKQAEVHQAQLFDELNHRVKNNLSLVSGILHMKARATDQEAVRDQLLRAVARVQSIAQVHEALYRGSRRSEVDFAEYLRELCEGVLHSLTTEDRFALDIVAEPFSVPIDTAIPLGMLANELVTNAVKYAYEPGEPGRIDVRFGKAGDTLVLSIADHGRGLGEGDDSEAGGLGLRLVRSLVEQVRGTLTVRRQPGAGFEIRFPSPGRSGGG